MDHSLISKLKELANELNRTPTARDFVKYGVSSRRITAAGGFNAILKAAGFEPRCKSAQNFLIRSPRILYFDIETSYMLVKVYGLKTSGYISHKNIVYDWHLLSYAAQWEGEDVIHYLDQRFTQDVSDDRQLIEGLHHLLSQADVVVGHNIDGFDLKKFNTRAAKYNLPPLHKLTTHDTLKIARKYFAFSSNSLDYIAKYLELKNRKSSHGAFPGDALWEACMNGVEAAWNECRSYNEQDVRVTRELYMYLSRYDSRIQNSCFNLAPTCSCGSKSFIKNGHRYYKGGVQQRYRCTACDKPYVAKQNMVDKDLRARFFQ